MPPHDLSALDRVEAAMRPDHSRMTLRSRLSTTAWTIFGLALVPVLVGLVLGAVHVGGGN